MKMNKIIIPTVAIAMGAALVGSVSSTLAWYQYSTKAQAAFIGTSVGESENLEIETNELKQGSATEKVWKTSLTSSDVNGLAGIQNANSKNIIPITTGAVTATSVLPTNFYNSVDTGVGGVETYGSRYANVTNYVQFNLKIRYKRLSYTEGANPSYLEKQLKLVDLTIVDEAGPVDQNTNKATTKDLYKAIRVHFQVGSGDNATGKLFARDSLTKIEASEQNAAKQYVTTDTFGQLDTDNDGKLDAEAVYEWEEEGAPVVYGENNSHQIAYNAAYGDLNETLGTLPTNENGLTVKVTIWLEGWQKLSGYKATNYDAGDDTEGQEREAADASAVWDPTVYVGKAFKVGMRFKAE